MQKFIKEEPMKHAAIVSLDAAPRRIGAIDILPWREFLTRLWSGAGRTGVSFGIFF